MNRAHRKRLLRRARASADLQRDEAVQLQMRLIMSWRGDYQRRFRVSPADAREFQQRKECELRDLGADEAMIGTLRSACSEMVTVPARLVSNYEAVELLQLREVRKR